MPTVIGEPGGRTAAVEVVVQDQAGQPVAGELVRLVESGTPTPSRPTARTASDGRILFHEGVGPPPCNTMTIHLPDRGQQQRAGCFNGGEGATVEFGIERPFNPDDVGIACESNPTASLQPGENITVAGRVSNPTSVPVSGRVVALLDGAEVSGQSVDLDAGESRVVEPPAFAAPSAPGSYSVGVDVLDVTEATSSSALRRTR